MTPASQRRSDVRGHHHFLIWSGIVTRFSKLVHRATHAELAQWDPSNCNIQPWQVYVASGATRGRLREKFVQTLMRGAPDSIGFLAGISFGYEDPSVPANRTRMSRAPLEENIVFKD